MGIFREFFFPSAARCRPPSLSIVGSLSLFVLPLQKVMLGLVLPLPKTRGENPLSPLARKLVPFSAPAIVATSLGMLGASPPPFRVVRSFWQLFDKLF